MKIEEYRSKGVAVHRFRALRLLRTFGTVCDDDVCDILRMMLKWRCWQWKQLYEQRSTSSRERMQLNEEDHQAGQLPAMSGEVGCFYNGGMDTSSDASGECLGALSNINNVKKNHR